MSKKAGKEKHPLFNTWSHARRNRNLSETWYKDFWLFVLEVGERPLDCRLYKLDDSLPLGPDNFQWVKVKQKLTDYESKAAYMRDYMRSNRDKQKHQDLKKRFGITLSQFREKQKEQANVCAICGNPETTIDNRNGLARDLAVDHNHSTGQVRGLLCRGCNQGIGNFKENLQVLESAIAYLVKHHNQGD